MSRSYKLLISLIIGLMAFSCTGRHHDKRLTAVAEIVTNNPKEALQRLDSIDTEQLTAADRHFYDFLTIKARDKAYVYHTSDSLILDVVSYYSSHDKARYPEALYYGGRVYSDLGDYPTALRYFQEALDQLPADTKDLDLKCRLLSQTGRLLNTLRLYKEAIPYIESSIELNRPRHDTINTIYDLQLLGGICLRAKMYEEAEKYLTEALDLSKNFPERHEAKTKMYLAQIKYETGQIDSALTLIRNVPSRVSAIAYNTALAYAARIYLDAGVLDTAYLYAHDLIYSSDRANKEIGYQTIFSPELIGKIPFDSLAIALSNYTSLLNSYYNRHKYQLAIEQVARYNYQLHERERIKAEHSREIFKNVTIVFLIVLLILCVLYYRQKVHSKNIIIKLQTTISNFSKASIDSSLPSLDAAAPTEQALREELIKKVKSILENEDDNFSLDSHIIASVAYKQLQDMITQEKILKDTDPLWKEIEKTVNTTFPNFIVNLNVLTSGKLKDIELQTALLIKFGIRPSQMMILFGKSNGTINSRRETLGVKIFGTKVSVKEVDKLIRYL